MPRERDERDPFTYHMSPDGILTVTETRRTQDQHVPRGLAGTDVNRDTPERTSLPPAPQPPPPRSPPITPTDFATVFGRMNVNIDKDIKVARCVCRCLRTLRTKEEAIEERWQQAKVDREIQWYIDHKIPPFDHDEGDVDSD